MKKKIILSGIFLGTVIFSGIIFFGLMGAQILNKAISFEKRGNQAFEEKSYAAALQYWMKAQETSENKAQLYWKIGKAYLKLSNLDQAEVFFKKALEKNPLALNIQKWVIRIFLLKGDIAGAEKSLDLIREKADKDPQVIMLSGDLAMLRGELKRAEADYHKAIEILPERIRPKLKLAVCLAEQKRAGAAEKIVKKIQVDTIETPLDLMLFADYYLLIKSYPEAETLILKAIEKDSGNLAFKIQLCRFYRSTGKREKAEGYLKKLIVQYPDNADFKLMLADTHLSALDIAGTEKWLKASERHKDEGAGYYLLMGKLWLVKGLHSHAVSYLKAALEQNSTLVSARYLLGVAYFAGGQTKLAENELIRALMIDPHHVEVLLTMAGLHYKNQAYSLAIQYLDRVISMDPSNFRAWQIKGLCLLEQEDYSKASDAVSKAWYLGGRTYSLFALGEAFDGQGKKEAALRVYDSVLTENPGLSDALYRHSRIMVGEGKGKQTLEKIDHWIDRGMTDPAVYYTGARISLELKEYRRCQTYLEKAMGSKKVSGEFYLLLADLYREKGEDSSIKKVLEECTLVKPGFLKGWLELAGYYMTAQQRDAAKNVLENALKQFPDEPEVMGNLAWLLLEEEIEIDRAFELARDAYDRLPGQAWLMDTLGWAYYHKKIYSQAMWMLAQADERSPGNGVIQYHQGMVFYRQGKLSQAREKIEAALGGDDLYAVNLEVAQKILAGLNGKKVPEEAGENVILNLEAVPSFGIEGMPDDEDDILEPDWNNLKSP